jgi:hypothetical protein
MNDPRRTACDAYQAGQHFERHHTIQTLQARLAELQAITRETGPEGRAAYLCAELERIITQLQQRA